jgi:hypothetical protein
MLNYRANAPGRIARGKTGTNGGLQRETEAGVRESASVTCKASNRCSLGIRLMGRWRIPETQVAQLERKLSAAGNCHEMPTCRIYARFVGWRDVFGPNIPSFPAQ